MGRDRGWNITPPEKGINFFIQHQFDQNGKMRPLVIEFEADQKSPVDKIVDVRRAACQSVGGIGERYTYWIKGKESYLWFEKGRWFVAAKAR